jgi:hypothetical protein
MGQGWLNSGPTPSPFDSPPAYAFQGGRDAVGRQRQTERARARRPGLGLGVTGSGLGPQISSRGHQPHRSLEGAGQLQLGLNNPYGAQPFRQGTFGNAWGMGTRDDIGRYS